jgi:hypothetical protein
MRQDDFLSFLMDFREISDFILYQPIEKFDKYPCRDNNSLRKSDAFEYLTALCV